MVYWSNALALYPISHGYWYFHYHESFKGLGLALRGDRDDRDDTLIFITHTLVLEPLQSLNDNVSTLNSAPEFQFISVLILSTEQSVDVFLSLA